MDYRFDSGIHAFIVDGELFDTLLRPKDEPGIEEVGKADEKESLDIPAKQVTSASNTEFWKIGWLMGASLLVAFIGTVLRMLH